jgi:hypothetical protein
MEFVVRKTKLNVEENVALGHATLEFVKIVQMGNFL